MKVSHKKMIKPSNHILPKAKWIKPLQLTITIVFTILLLLACSKKSTPPPPSLPQWTILGYFDGNNNQDKKIVNGDTLSYVIKDVQEMEQVGSTKDVQVIVMLGSFKTNGNCNYYFIEKCLDDTISDSISSKVLEDSLEQNDMSDPQTLRDFVKYGVEHYPAQHYILIIDDDGLGWKGVCSDTINGDGKWMSLSEVSSALLGYRFEIIVCNAHSMSMVEVAYQLKEEANFLVASEYYSYSYPRNILGLSAWLQDLTNNPNLSGKSIARSIATAIYNASKSDRSSVSAIDLSKVDALTSKIADLGSLLITHTGTHWKEVVDARQIAVPLFTEHFDLKRFSQNIQDSTDLDSTIKNAAQEVVNANDAAVIKMESNQPELGYGGLCIHFPKEPAEFDSARYVELDFAISNWHVFLSRFIQAYAEANTGSLRIVSVPVKGAWIFLDGDSTGLVTDTTIHGIPAGRHKVKVVKAGWHMLMDEPEPARVYPGSTTEVIIPLLQGSPPKESISELQ
jgi:hypothetical protein